MFDCGPLYLANLNSKADIVINQGGTSSGKTYSILQVLFSIAISETKQVITVAGQDIPNLKVGAIRDALDIVSKSEELKSLLAKPYNKSERVFEFISGSIIEFKSYDDSQDAKSGKRDYLFLNEANGIPFEVYSELHLRTRKRTFIDYNPNAEFWVHEYLIGQPKVQLIISDHRHNPFLSDKQREKIESLKSVDIELWRVYARGKTGKIEGLIFRNWDLVDKIPEGAKFIGTGLDFGFTNDETGVLDVYQQNGELWVDELVYQTGLTNQDIGGRLLELGFNKRKEIIADSSEPKSIEELRRLGWNVQPALKGPDSILASIDIIKRYKINVTRRSVNLRKELNNYKWKDDLKTGKSINEPIDRYNHLIDPLRYVALNKLRVQNTGRIRSTV
jgi:phage terminase large subunit